MATPIAALIVAASWAAAGASLDIARKARDNKKAAAELTAEANEAQLEYEEGETELQQEEFELTRARQRQALMERGEFNIGAAQASHGAAGALAGSTSVISDITRREEKLTEEITYLDTLTDIDQERFENLLGEGGYYDQQSDFIERGLELQLDAFDLEYSSTVLGTTFDVLGTTLGGFGGGGFGSGSGGGGTQLDLTGESWWLRTG